MRIITSEYITTGVKKGQFPIDGVPEIGFVGRSNVGKSSLINLITNRKKLVKVSGKPGKTRTVNFFLINNNVFFVDLPGYGYAQVSKEMKKTWGNMMDEYFIGRDEIKGVVLLLDIRHKPTVKDIEMFKYLKYYRLKTIIVCTKSDKLSNNGKYKNIKMIKETIGSGSTPVILTSATKKEGIDDLLNEIELLLEESKID